MSTSQWTITTLLACAGLAALGAIPHAFHTPTGLVVGQWAVSVLAALVAAACLLACNDARSPTTDTRIARTLTALTLAALAPLAVEATARMEPSHASFAAVALSVVLTQGSPRIVRWLGAAAMAGLATAMDVTAILWPLGAAWASIAYRRRIGANLLLLAAAAVGLATAAILGSPLLTASRLRVANYAVNRDLLLFMPLILPGLAGYAAHAFAGVPRDQRARRHWLAGWTATGIIALFLTLVGFPLNLRLCVLPFCWWAPAGLRELTSITRDPQSPPALKCIGSLSCLLLALFALHATHAWLQAPLLALHLLAPA